MVFKQFSPLLHRLAFSPDFNPIETLVVVQTKVSSVKISIFDDFFAWEAIPISVCENLVSLMSSRCQADNNGFATKY